MAHQWQGVVREYLDFMPFSSEDRFAFHKTTRRERYERALDSAPPGVDEVLLVNEHGELTEGTRTNLMVQMGGEVWLTPPVESGLLPGVLREHLLRTGEAVESAEAARVEAKGLSR